MKTKHWFITMPAVVLALNVNAEQLNTARIEQITGLKGVLNQKENVFKVSTPRTDIKVSVDGWLMQPFRGLGSWAAFTGTDAHAIVMGDFVLFRDEVNPVMSAALDNGLSVTALHNHFFYDDPKVYFMHIGSQGPAEKLAAGVRAMLDAEKRVRAAHPQPATSFGGQPPAKNAITAAPIERILGKQGQSNNGMLKLTFPRETTAMGMTMGGDMGVATWAAFGGTDDNAIVDGDFAVHEDELQGVLKALRAGGINIVAIHNHMTGE
ncbi:MAG: DUF1259 domain-containing protein, partial [Verrucomicrobiota bacterium]|nr:DUF1259 domain-containing protein [Verrucomicrobiota bacterium]